VNLTDDGHALTPRAQRVIDEAGHQADRFGHTYVGTEHLLLALLADPQGIAAKSVAAVSSVAALREEWSAV
jgi:ATP-dependent Clp protease ATP-binding subunit ClpA